MKAFFLTLDRNALRSWQERPHVKARIESLRDGVDRWIQQRRQRGENISDRVVRDEMRPAYLLAHFSCACVDY